MSDNSAVQLLSNAVFGIREHDVPRSQALVFELRDPATGTREKSIDPVPIRKRTALNVDASNSLLPNTHLAHSVFA